MTNVIEVRSLRKIVRGMRHNVVAVDDLSLDVPAGGVFGFLGPNGSGKTTTIRCLLGLARPTSGDIRLFGAAVPARLPAVVGRIGALVEAPGVNGGLSALQAVSVLATAAGVSHRRVGEVLDIVGLADRADDAARGYSLGMRQRLGVAIALLKDPELLVLDEPANGLDPAGIREMRDLLRRLGDEGRTVFVSSHQLAEVQQTCDRVAIVARGRVVRAGTVDDVLAQGATRATLVRVPNARLALKALHSAGISADEVDGYLRVMPVEADAPTVARELGSRGIWPLELRPDSVSLEDVFLEITEAAS
ncbi:MAG TPA: ATP-binding cassette domain-containing protein [Acidimicrobiales bacterium]|nr:ATP-binding cassette domain-containing protein [Acidimicrobiales bacterium]